MPANEFIYNKRSEKWKEKIKRVGIAAIIKHITQKDCATLTSWIAVYAKKERDD